MCQQSFFLNNMSIPLAAALRPQTLAEFVGQTHLIGEKKILQKMIETDKICSLIFWGPAGVGKTTLATIIANTTKGIFKKISAVSCTIKEAKSILEEAEKKQSYQKTILFIDEIHRFNKAQQDVFLPYVENGSIVLIGATTENPSFEINNALLSRCRVFVMKPLVKEDLIKLLKRALNDKRGFGNYSINIEDDILTKIAEISSGDARKALSMLEMIILNSDIKEDKIFVTEDILEQCLTKKAFIYDKNGEEHYNTISALHKSMRNSDPDAAVYWLARMLEAGEDPLYIARRIVRFASEDIGLADYNALNISISAYQACHFIGMPECAVHLTEAVIYMSLVPKSNAIYIAFNKAKEDATVFCNEPVPLWLRNAPTNLMKNLGYGKNYIYAHDKKEKISNMQCLPDNLKDKEYYFPTEEGHEIKFKQRLNQIKEWKKNND